MPAFSVLGFGASAIDDIVYTAAAFNAGKGRILRRERAFGGNVATALVAVAKLGGRAGFVGWVGDMSTDAGAAEMARSGVDVSAAPRHPDAAPIRSTIIVGPDGERFIAYDDDVPHGTAEDLADAVLAQGRVLLVDGYAVHALAVVERARSLGLAIVADVEWAGEGTDRLLALCDHLVLPIDFARAYVAAVDVETVLDRLWAEGRSAVVLTDGDRGAYLRQDDGSMWHMPAHAVNPIDTTGAGDCFHGAYALGMSEGGTPLDSVRLATAASALAVTGRGGRAALPTRDQCASMQSRPEAPVPVRMRPSERIVRSGPGVQGIRR